jgi:hypothetical protein
LYTIAFIPTETKRLILNLNEEREDVYKACKRSEKGEIYKSCNHSVYVLATYDFQSVINSYS